MNKNKLIIYFFVALMLVAFGVFLIVFGERDDSPGAQGLGLLIVVLTVITAWKGIKNNK